MHPFILVAITRAEGRAWIAEHFPDTSGWFYIHTPRTSPGHDDSLFLAAYATPQALARRNELIVGRAFKFAATAVRIGVSRRPERVI